MIMKKWTIYLKERSPLPALIFVAAIAALSASTFKGTSFDFLFVILATIINTLLFIQLRIADEIKDYQKDQVVNPDRPLPRGLITKHEALTALKLIIVGNLFMALMIAILYQLISAILLTIAVLFGWLMYKEFYIGQRLSRYPILYAISHQIIVFFIYGWLGFYNNSLALENSSFLYWLIANFAASFTFEISRKLNPDSHPLSETYLQFYGKQTTSSLIFILLFILTLTSWLAGILNITMPMILLQFFVTTRWLGKPSLFKSVENIAVLLGLSVAIAPFINKFLI